MKNLIWLITLIIGISSCQMKTTHDLIIRNGLVYDGSGAIPVLRDIAVNADSIAAIGVLSSARGKIEIDAEGLAVAPGFINMLSWANESLIEDGRSQSDIRQGVTLEVMGEGNSMGPLNPVMKEEWQRNQGDIKYDITWTSLDEYLNFISGKGISCNVASFIGATSVRIHEIGYEDRAPKVEELKRMKNLVRQAMEDGAVGISSSLIYAPAFYAKTDELIELCKIVAEYDGLYTSHVRSEGARFLQALDEFINISKEAGIRSEIYHLKSAGKSNWHKMDPAIAKIDSARDTGLRITADMYTYTAASTGLDASMPPWVQEGGDEAWAERLRDPAIRKRLMKEIATPSDEWENFYVLSGTTDNILLVGFKTDSLKKYTGKTLTEVAEIRKTHPIITMMDLVVQNHGDVQCVYFLMSDENVEKQIALDYVSFCSDSDSQAPEGIFLESNPHPRAYGTFARLLGKYVREKQVISLEEAIRRLSSLPATNLKLEKRGMLKSGYFADIVVFNPDKIIDRATFTEPHQYAEGMVHVFVNGVQVLKDGEHTGATPGRVVRGPGWKK